MTRKPAKIKKILITSSSYLPNIGGIENSIYYLAKAGEDDLITIVTSDHVNNVNSINGRKKIKGRILRYSLPSNKNKFIRALLGLKNAYLTYRQMKKEKQELVISRYHLNTVLCYLAGLRNINYIVPGVVKYQDRRRNVDNYSSSFYHEISYYYNRFIQYLAFKLSDNVYVFSQNMIRQVKSINQRCNVILTAPGIDSEKFYFSDIKDSEVINLLILSRLNSAKNIEMAIDSISYLPKEYNLIVVGDGPLLGSLRLYTEKKQLTGRVVFEGAQASVEGYYAKSHVFLLPSIYEPFGQTLLEASSCGVPTAAFHPDIVNTATLDILGDFAIYATALNAESFSKAIINAYTQYYLRAEKSRLSLREYIINKYSWDRLYKEISQK